jgi:pimeloyl-ACP methyl ester carboxylesterase
MLRSFAEGTVFGELWGADPPRVLALHGWRRTHDDFAGVLGPASSSGAAPSLGLDLPGFGATPPPQEAWGSAEYAQLVAGVLAELDGDPTPPGSPGPGSGGQGPFVVIGHSFGGRVAVHLAAQRPELVRALVLTGVPLVRLHSQSARAPARYRAVRALRRANLVPESMLERARQRYGSADYLAAEGVMRQVLVRLTNEDYAEQIATIRCPVELVWADNDTEAPLGVGEAVAARIRGSKLTVCPGAGHMTPLTVPDVLRKAVDAALGAPSGASAR